MNPEELNARGLEHWEARNLGAAFADFSAAIDAAPRDPAAFTNRGGLRLARRAEGDLEAAIVDLNRALLVQSDYQPALRNLGLAMLIKGDVGGAALQFARSLEKEPDDAWTLVQYGVTLGISGCHREALEHFDRAVTLDPEMKEAWANRAEARKELGLTQEAAADLAVARRLGLKD